MSFPSFDTWLKAISKVGFPIGAFLLLFFGVKEAVTWIGTEVVKPAVKAHVDLVGSLEVAIKEQTEVQRENSATNAATSESVKKLSEVYAEQTDLLRTVVNRDGEPKAASGPSN